MTDVPQTKPFPFEISSLSSMIEQVVDLLPIGLWVINKDGKIIYGNREAIDIWGGARYVDQPEYGQFVAWSIPDNKPLTANDWASVRALNKGEVVLNEELKIQTFDGALKIILNSAIPIKDDQGNITSCFIINQDITNLRTFELQLSQTVTQLEKKVQESEMFKLGVEQAAEHIVITDPDGIILYANRGVERITGFSTQEVVGTKAGKLWSKPMEPAFYEEMWDTIKHKKQIFRGEIQNKRKNGQIYTAMATISPILDSNQQVQFFLGLERDITKEKEVDQAKSEFVSFASHQLRTPLTAVRWYTEMLMNGDAGQLTPEQQKYLTEVDAGNKRMIQLVSALLNVSRIEIGSFAIEPKPTQLAGLITTEVEEARVLAEQKKVSVETQLDHIDPIAVDQKLMSIVFENLITNAIKYSTEGGHVHITLRKIDADTTLHDQAVPANTIYCEVQDNGIGIPAHQHDKMFSKLFRADNAVMHDTNGNGLGLYITKSIIENSNGHIWFSSQENKGTSFCFWLPLTGMIAHAGTRHLESTNEQTP